MSTRQYVAFRFTLQDTEIPVWRDVAIKSNLMVEALDVVLQQLFDFSAESLFEYDINGELQSLERLQSQTMDHLFQADIESMACFIESTDNWEVQMQLIDYIEHNEMDLPFFCMNGEGQGILHSEMTKPVYNAIVDAALLGETDFSEFTELPLDLIGEEFFEIDILEVNQRIQDKFVFRDTHDDDMFSQLEHTHDEDDEHTTAAPKTSAEIEALLEQQSAEELNEEFIMHETVVAFYTQVMGLTEEQAAYHVLYETAINTVYEKMSALGYEADEIEATLKGTRALEESLYAEVQDDLDILAALPGREEYFTEEDESRLVKVEETIFAVLSQRDLTIESLLLLDDAALDEVEEAFMQAIQSIEAQPLS